MNKRLERIFASKAWKIWRTVFEIAIVAILFIVTVAMLQRTGTEYHQDHLHEQRNLEIH